MLSRSRGYGNSFARETSPIDRPNASPRENSRKPRLSRTASRRLHSRIPLARIVSTFPRRRARRDDGERLHLPADFHQAVATAASPATPEQVTITLPIDVAVVEWFKGKLQPTDWQHRMAEVLAFYVETNQPAPGHALESDAGPAPIIGL